MTAAANALLAQIAAALGAQPFAGTVRIGGAMVDRATARAMERGLLRERKAARQEIAA